MIHAMIDFNYTLCGTGLVQEEGDKGHSSVAFPQYRDQITCPICLDEVARRVDGTQLTKFLRLSVRALNALTATQIYTMEYVESMSDDELLRIPNFGKTSLKEVRTIIRHWRGHGPMTKAELHNALRILWSIDLFELQEMGLWVDPDSLAMKRWESFQDNPYEFFIRCDDETADRIWSVIQRRSEKKPPAPSIRR
jgi:hypothetical protein